MRHRGNTNEYGRLRDAELLRHYKAALSRSIHITEPQAIHTAVTSPCSRFWVSEERAYAVVLTMLRGKPCPSRRRQRRRMFREIFRRVMQYRRLHPEISLKNAVRHIVYRPAPEFYLTDLSARTLLSKHKKEIRQTRSDIVL